MFKKLFSCLGDGTHQEQQADLSGNVHHSSEGAPQAKPILHPESNIQGQTINFEMDDFQSNNLLQMHFFQQQNTQKHQKYYYEQEDGEVESKITTASPSKTQYYHQQIKEEHGVNNKLQHENQHNLYFKGVNYQPNPNLPDFSPNAARDAKGDFTQTSSQTQAKQEVTEKKLNNYLQQAKFLISAQSQQTPFSPSQQTSPYQNYQNELVQAKKSQTMVKGKPFSQDLGNSQYNATEVMQMSHLQSYLPAHMQNIYSLDSCPSTKVLFNNNFAYEEQHEPLISSDQINLKASFNSVSKRTEKLPYKKKSIDLSRKSYTDKKPTVQSKARLSQINKESLSNFYSHRNSEMSRASTQQKLGYGKMKTESPYQKGAAMKASPNQIIDQLDNIIIEDVQDDVQELRVLDYDDDNSEKQMDLGHLKAMNKRQTSKTEVFSPLGHRKKASHVPVSSKQPLLQQQSSTKSNVSRTSNVGSNSHKKTLSNMQTSSQGTRNSGLRSKHMTVTTSPVMEKQTLEKAQARLRLTSGKKSSQKISSQTQAQTQPSPKKKNTNPYQMGIQEDQYEDDDQYRQHHHETQQHPHFQLLHREFDIMNSAIAPSTSSNFQFQPKFFKPKFGNQSNGGGQNSQSLESSDQIALQSLVAGMELPKPNNNQQDE